MVSRKEYESLFNKYLQEKLDYLKIFSKDNLTIEICKGLSDEPELVEYIPFEISEYNEISEEGRYFIINDKKVKKVAFLQEILPRGIYEKLCYTNTSGKLLLTIDPLWFKLCSDNNYCSWTSCFSPNGDNWFCPYEYSLSKHCLLALIVNDDESKIIARRFIFIPEGEDGLMSNIIFFNRHYGTFPVSYQRELSNYIISKIFEEDKDDWGYEFAKDDGDNEIVSEFERLTNVEGIGNHYGSWNRDFSYYEDNYYRSKIWIDFANYLFYRKPMEQERYLISFHNSLELYYCLACQCRYPLTKLIPVLCWDEDKERVYEKLMCPSCVNELTKRDIFNGKIYDEAVPHLDALVFQQDGIYIRVREGSAFLKWTDEIPFEEGVIDHLVVCSEHGKSYMICYNFNLVKDYFLKSESNPDGFITKKGLTLNISTKDLWSLNDRVYKLNVKLREDNYGRVEEVEEAVLPDVFDVPELDEEDPHIAL